MGKKIKSGFLLYYYEGFISKKWKNYYFILFDDSMLQWYNKRDDRTPYGYIRIRDVAKFFCVGPFTRCLPNRPKLSQASDETNLIGLPHSPPGNFNEDVTWIQCDQVSQLNEWMNAIVSTLPPLLEPNVTVPSHEENDSSSPAVSLSHNYNGAHTNSSVRSHPSTNSDIHTNKELTLRHTIVSIPLSSEEIIGISTRGSKITFDEGVLLGFHLGYKWGSGFSTNSMWEYGMGPVDHHDNYGECEYRSTGLANARSRLENKTSNHSNSTNHGQENTVQNKTDDSEKSQSSDDDVDTEDNEAEHEDGSGGDGADNDDNNDNNDNNDDDDSDDDDDEDQDQANDDDSGDDNEDEDEDDDNADDKDDDEDGNVNVDDDDSETSSDTDNNKSTEEDDTEGGLIVKCKCATKITEIAV